MGRATVASSQGEGSYTVSRDLGAAQKAAAIARLQAQLTALNEQKAKLAADLENKRQILDDATAVYTTRVDALAAWLENNLGKTVTDAPSKLIKDLADAEKLLTPAQLEFGQVDGKLKDTTIQIAAVTRQIGAYEALQVEVTQQAWCVDYTEDASGEVATLEIPGEPDVVVIAPGGRGPTAADGTVVAREVMDPNQLYWCAAALPGVQMWRPQYRCGVLTAVDYDANLVSLDLEDIRSSARDLSVNRTASMSGVPVDYMGSSSVEVFEVGDEVVVELQNRDWFDPRVIGFKHHPKEPFTFPNEIRVLVARGYENIEFQPRLHHSYFMIQFGPNAGDYGLQALSCGDDTFYYPFFSGDGPTFSDPNLLPALDGFYFVRHKITLSVVYTSALLKPGVEIGISAVGAVWSKDETPSLSPASGSTERYVSSLRSGGPIISGSAQAVFSGYSIENFTWYTTSQRIDCAGSIGTGRVYSLGPSVVDYDGVLLQDFLQSIGAMPTLSVEFKGRVQHYDFQRSVIVNEYVSELNEAHAHLVFRKRPRT